MHRFFTVTSPRAITWSRDERIKSLLLSLQDDTLYAVGPPVSDHPKCEGFVTSEVDLWWGSSRRVPTHLLFERESLRTTFFICVVSCRH